ncbi:hypothetical protein BGX26_009400 [Mortierella sp. AD094]|nr:hypothetical protein BGX26_009400 [Mortierella sp. AD094]
MVQSHFLSQDIIAPAAKFTMPESGGRITSTPQLAYCLSLLQPSLLSKEGLNEAECNWLQVVDSDPDEQARLQSMATDVIRAFVQDGLKKSGAVAEVVSLAAVLEQDDFRKLLQVFVDGIEQSLLLEIHLLDGLAYLMRNAPQGSLDADDLVKILELLNTRLKGTHQQSTQRDYRLALSVSCVLNSMFDCQVEGLEREQLHEPLYQYLKELQQSSDPCLVYQAAYAFQALQYIPDNETILKAMLRRTGKVVRGISGVVSAVKALDLDQFIDGLQHIQEEMPGVKDVISMVNDAYKDAKGLAESGQGFLESLKEGLSFSRKSAWYLVLRGLDSLLQEGRLAEFDQLIRKAPCQSNPAFQWGVCQRLGELAANTVWDTKTRQCAIAFLGEIYIDDAQWGQHANIKQWILRILSNLAELTEEPVAGHAKGLLRNLESDGDMEKRALYQVCVKEYQDSYAVMVTLSSPKESRLLNSVQNIPEVETPLRQLRYERLKERGQDVYVSPRAKLHANATSDFDLMSKVQEFLSSDRKVFLLLGDSGAGKSTFNRTLEIDLWDKYGKTDNRIPLFIHLPAIDKPENCLIDKQLQHLNFTESQIRELKLHREFILICDGYDESQQTQNLYMSNQLNQAGQWHAQMVISCRTESIGVDYRSCFRPTDRNNGGNSNLFQEVTITPFNSDQIQDYVEQYVILREPPWKSEDYLQALKQVPNLRDLVTNPFLLKISLEVLPRLLKTNSEFSASRITRVELYDEFVAQWIERGQIRLREIELSPRDQEAFNMLLDSGFNQVCISYLKELATAIYDNQRGNPSVDYSERRDQKTWKRIFFNNLDGKNLLRESIPLIRSSEQYRFIHRSVLEYGLALAVFDPTAHNESQEPTLSSSRRGSASSALSFEDSALIKGPTNTIEKSLLDSPFGRKSFVADRSISQFLVERAQQQPVFMQQLLSAIERSKTDKEVRVAAANAITVLVRAGVKFIGADLRGIKIPGADLSYGMFDSAQLDEADLRKATLCNIWLRKASLCEAQMTGVKFGELPLLQIPLQVCCCAYSREGVVLAVGLDDGFILLYRRTSRWGIVRLLEGHSDDVLHLAFSESDDRLASGSKNGEVRVWDVETGDCVRTLQCDGEIRVWDAEGVETFHFPGEILDIVAYSPNGFRVASGSKDNIVRLWDVETDKHLQILQGHDRRVYCATYSPNQGQIASGSVDNTVRLWSVATGKCVHILEGHGEYVLSVAYSPDGGQIASGGFSGVIKLWNVETGNCVHTLHGHSNFVNTIMYSPNGVQIASGGMDQTVRLWNVETGDCVHTLNGHNSTVTSIKYSPKGDQICSTSSDRTVRLWHVETGNFSPNLQGHNASVNAVAYSPNGEKIASGSLDTTVRLWDVETGNCLHTLHDGTIPIYTIAYSPKGGQIASGGEDKTVWLWDVVTGKCIHTFQGHDGAVHGIAFSPNGGQIASGGMDKTVRLWNVETGDCTSTFQGHDGALEVIAYSPDGNQIASGSSDKTVRLWDVQTGSCVHTFQGHSGGVTCAAFSPSGSQIASGSDDKTVRTWSIETGSCVYTLEGHTEMVMSVAYSPKGDWVVSGSYDNMVLLWDIDIGQFLVAITGFSGTVTSIACQDTSNGQYLVTGSADKSVRRWRITKDGNEYQAHLCWSSSNDGLVVAEANFSNVQGLSQEDWALLQQRRIEMTVTQITE